MELAFAHTATTSYHSVALYRETESVMFDQNHSCARAATIMAELLRAFVPIAEIYWWVDGSPKSAASADPAQNIRRLADLL